MIRLRNSIKAIIVEEGRLLMMKNRNADEGVYYVLPGGGQNGGETFPAALARECLEELGCPVQVGQLALIREYIGQNHQLAYKHSRLHQIEFMFYARLLAPPNPAAASEADRDQQGCVWLPLAELDRYNLYPRALAASLGPDGRVTGPLYLGDAR